MNGGAAVCPRCGHPIAANSAGVAPGPATFHCEQCGQRVTFEFVPDGAAPATDLVRRRAWHRTLCFRVLADLRACDTTTLMKVAATQIADADLPHLERQLVALLRAVRIARSTPEDAFGQQLGELLVELGQVATVARERVGDGVLRVLPLATACDVLCATVDLLTDVGFAAQLAAESVAGVQTVDLDAARPL